MSSLVPTRLITIDQRPVLGMLWNKLWGFYLQHLEKVVGSLRKRPAQCGHLPIYRYVYPLWNVFFKLFNFLDLSLFCCKFPGSVGLFVRSVVTGRTSTSEKGIGAQRQGWGRERATEDSPLPPNTGPPGEVGKLHALGLPQSCPRHLLLSLGHLSSHMGFYLRGVLHSFRS